LTCVFTHGADLQGKRLLIVRRNASVKAHPKGVAKNPVRWRFGKSLFSGHFRSVRLTKGGLARSYPFRPSRIYPITRRQELRAAPVSRGSSKASTPKDCS